MTRRARLVVALLAGTAALTACGSASAPYPPTGVDQLVIPTPSLDPADFVDAVDNPWLPLAPGSEWRYTRTAHGDEVTVIVTVAAAPHEVQGVPATVVTTAVSRRAGQAQVEATDWYAQDADGNVWHLGEQGAWEAGVDGAEAGLAMAAHPRVGDGYRTGYAPGVAEDTAEVVDTAGSASVPYGDLTDLVATEERSPLDPGVVDHLFYARGIGLVRELGNSEGDELLELVAFTG
jgi:hypothetical protein